MFKRAFAVPALLAFATFALAGCGSDPPPVENNSPPVRSADATVDASPSYSSSQADEDLATIELGHPPDRDDSTLLRITNLLNNMQADCPANTRTQLADFTANSLLRLEKAGIDATPTEILTDVRESSSLGVSDDCLDVFALYVLLRQDEG